jgi:16S rRNA processing protein RimM
VSELEAFQEWIAVGRILRPRGTRGEVIVEPLTGYPERLREIRRAAVARDNGSARRELEVAGVWQHGGRWIFRFRGVGTVTEAEALRGCELQLPASARLTLPEGEYYLDDLTGCDVVDSVTGERIGKVTGWVEHGGQALLAVRDGECGGEFLLPFARGLLSVIDPGRKLLAATLPEGLRELNR